LAGSAADTELAARGREPAAMPSPTQGTPGKILFLTMVIFVMKILFFFFLGKEVPTAGSATRQTAHGSSEG